MAADSFYGENNVNVLKECATEIESGESVPKEHDLIEAWHRGILWEDEAWQEQDKNRIRNQKFLPYPKTKCMIEKESKC